jgi:hypothetical protein
MYRALLSFTQFKIVNQTKTLYGPLLYSSIRTQHSNDCLSVTIDKHQSFEETDSKIDKHQ